MIQKVDVAIVGAGIVGLAHAWMAAQRGLKVVVFERSAQAQGASVRNFGMIWPIGQPHGEHHSLAMRSRELWLELASLNVVEVEECGSYHLAHRPDEWEVLKEFADLKTHPVSLLEADHVTAGCPWANPQGLLGGMSSSTELRVNPRSASARIATWLAKQHGVTFHFMTPVSEVKDGEIVGRQGVLAHAERVIVCSGSELDTLLPRRRLNSDFTLCKLQMLKAIVPSAPSTMQPHIASGLTLRHYDSFRHCSTLDRLQKRVAEETPELDRFGIHVMASIFPNGDIILGDSHEYSMDISPFNNAMIDRLMIRELKKVIALTDWTIHERWYGVYGKRKTQPVYEYEDEGNGAIRYMLGTGGSGMTMAFGLAERAWKEW